MDYVGLVSCSDQKGLGTAKDFIAGIFYRPA